MAKREKISEERKKLIKEFISSNELKTAGDVEDALKNLFNADIILCINSSVAVLPVSKATSICLFNSCLKTSVFI